MGGWAHAAVARHRAFACAKRQEKSAHRMVNGGGRGAVGKQVHKGGAHEC